MYRQGSAPRSGTPEYTLTFEPLSQRCLVSYALCRFVTPDWAGILASQANCVQPSGGITENPPAGHFPGRSHPKTFHFTTHAVTSCHGLTNMDIKQKIYISLRLFWDIVCTWHGLHGLHGYRLTYMYNIRLSRCCLLLENSPGSNPSTQHKPSLHARTTTFAPERPACFSPVSC